MNLFLCRSFVAPDEAVAEQLPARQPGEKQSPARGLDEPRAATDQGNLATRGDAQSAEPFAPFGGGQQTELDVRVAFGQRLQGSGEVMLSVAHGDEADSGQFRAGRWVASRAPKPKAKLLGPAGALKHWTSGHRKGR